MLVNFMYVCNIFMAVCNVFIVVYNILWPFVIFYGRLQYFIATCYILWSFGTYFTVFGMLYQEKSLLCNVK
jgi:hypothetical protein